jgi:hypothetical protein
MFPFNKNQQNLRVTRTMKNDVESKYSGMDTENILTYGRERKKPERYGAGVCHGYPDHHFIGGGFNLYHVGRQILANGHTDVCFDRQLHPGNATILNFQMTGTRAGDDLAANAINNWVNTPAGYTWHHKHDFVAGGVGGRCTLQLVLSNCHNHIFHHGAVSQWNAFYPLNLYA